jgi:transcriptional regulator with XRE-family HTH domain
VEASGATVDTVIAECLASLFATVHPCSRGPYLLREVADGINHAAGHELISVAYLSQLRLGQRTEPSWRRLLAIAKFFGVPLDYFDPELGTTEIMAAAAALADPRIRSIAVRAAVLSQTSLDAISTVVETLGRLEGQDLPQTRLRVLP